PTSSPSRTTAMSNGSRATSRTTRPTRCGGSAPIRPSRTASSTRSSAGEGREARPMRFGFVIVAMCSLLCGGVLRAQAADPAFARWLESLWPEAQQLGVSRATFDAATRGLEPDLSLPDLVIPGRAQAPPRGQAEFVQTPADYVKEATIARLAAQGRDLLAKHRATLAAIERQFGVAPPILLAICGPATGYGL